MKRKYKLSKTNKYTNYIIIGASLIPYFMLSFDYITNNLDSLKYYYPMIPLTFSTYLIGVTLVTTKLTDKIRSLKDGQKCLLKQKQCDKMNKQ